VKIRLRPGETYKSISPSEAHFVLDLAGPAYVLEPDRSADEMTMLARIDPERRSSPELVDIARFEVVDARMPSTWRVRLGSQHRANWLYIAPEPWLRPRFWEDFFGERFDEHPGTLDAQAEYARELQLMLEELG
jgi:hypothetical protein